MESTYQQSKILILSEVRGLVRGWPASGRCVVHAIDFFDEEPEQAILVPASRVQQVEGIQVKPLQQRPGQFRTSSRIEAQGRPIGKTKLALAIIARAAAVQAAAAQDAGIKLELGSDIGDGTNYTPSP